VVAIADLPHAHACHAAQYLSPEERAAAPTLYRALSAIQAEYERAGGEPVAASQLVQSAMEVLDTEPLFTHVDYISIADPDSFQELTTVKSSGVAGDVANAAVVSAAVQIGKTRLLDNILL
jgi:pantoate--beta-alanine ligase